MFSTQIVKNNTATQKMMDFLDQVVFIDQCQFFHIYHQELIIKKQRKRRKNQIDIFGEKTK